MGFKRLTIIIDHIISEHKKSHLNKGMALLILLVLTQYSVIDIPDFRTEEQVV